MGGFWVLRRIDTERERGFVLRVPLPFLWYGRVYEAYTDEVLVGFYTKDFVVRVLPDHAQFFVFMFGVFKRIVFRNVATTAPALNTLGGK